MIWSKTPFRRQRPQAPQCWICGATADSGEHVFKRSDLVREHGPGPYHGRGEVAHVVAGTPRLVQGPGALQLKYQPSLCKACNTTRTQPFDRAYDAFVSWLWAHEEDVLATRRIDFSDVYGADWERRQSDLYKFFVKAFGCRLTEAGQWVPKGLVVLLAQERFRTRLRLYLVVNEGTLLLPPETRAGFLGAGDLMDCGIRDGIAGYTWHLNYRWLTTQFCYGVELDGEEATAWAANRQGLVLGSWQSLTPAQQEELVRRLDAAGRDRDTR